MSAALELPEAKELRELGFVRENRLSSKGAWGSSPGPASPIEAVSYAREDTTPWLWVFEQRASRDRMLSSGVLEPRPFLGRLNGFFYGPTLFGALNVVVWA